MRIRNRKALFLCSTILRGTQPRKAPDEGGDGIEVGAGFGEAAERMSGDDNRPKPKPAEEPKPKPAAAAQEEDDGDDGQGGEDEGEEGGDDAAGDRGEGEDGDDDGEEAPKKKRNTAAYVREVKRELREERRGRAALEARLLAIENGGLPNRGGNDNPPATSEVAPDPNDATKYPLGVLDDGFISDKIEFETSKGIARALDGMRQTEQTQAATAQRESEMAAYRDKAEELTERGSDLYDDFEEKVLNDGMAGKWKLTETTFSAAADATHGEEILYALASDKKEALRVSQLSPYQQLKYVQEKDAELVAAKPKTRTKPRAETPPAGDSPRGRNSSSPIRPDTDNLNDFRKIYYQK